MTTVQAVNWLNTQPSVSLLNKLNRLALYQLTQDSANATTLITQRVPLRRATSIEVTAFLTVTSSYTEILARLNVNWLNALQRSNLSLALTGQ